MAVSLGRYIALIVFLSEHTFCLQFLQKILILYSLTTHRPVFKVCNKSSLHIGPVLYVIFEC